LYTKNSIRTALPDLGFLKTPPYMAKAVRGRRLGVHWPC
jgi:hypothetical protein